MKIFIKNSKKAKSLASQGFEVEPHKKVWLYEPNWDYLYVPFGAQEGFSVSVPEELRHQSVNKIKSWFLENYDLMISGAKDVVTP
jgi:hypothetical protein